MIRVVLSIIIIILVLFLFVLLYPFDNLNVMGYGRISGNNFSQGVAEILNKNKIVHPGEMLVYKFTYHKKLNLPAEVTKEITLSINDGEYRILFKPFMGNIESGTHTITATVKIPDTDFVIGKSKLILHFKYSLFGGLRVINDFLETELFEIREKI